MRADRPPLARRTGLGLLGAIAALAAGLLTFGSAAGSAAPVKSVPMARWDVYVTTTYADTTTVTDEHCFPAKEQTTPSTVEGEAGRKLTMKTTKPGTVVMYEAPNGVPVVAEDATGTVMKVRVTEERSGQLEPTGLPAGCVAGAPPPKPDCGSRSISTGTYLGPLGKIRHWEGFTVEPQETPAPFEGCGLSAAQEELPEPLALDIKADPKLLSGRRPKLVFRKTIPIKLAGKHESTTSTATGTLTYKAELRRDR